jgi:hypothetical protein
MVSPSTVTPTRTCSMTRRSNEDEDLSAGGGVETVRVSSSPRTIYVSSSIKESVIRVNHTQIESKRPKKPRHKSTPKQRVTPERRKTPKSNPKTTPRRKLTTPKRRIPFTTPDQSNTSSAIPPPGIWNENEDTKSDISSIHHEEEEEEDSKTTNRTLDEIEFELMRLRLAETSLRSTMELRRKKKKNNVVPRGPTMPTPYKGTPPRRRSSPIRTPPHTSNSKNTSPTTITPTIVSINDQFEDALDQMPFRKQCVCPNVSLQWGHSSPPAPPNHSRKTNRTRTPQRRRVYYRSVYGSPDDRHLRRLLCADRDRAPDVSTYFQYQDADERHQMLEMIDRALAACRTPKKI